ncbi:hypothetical protein DYB37_001912 [Aphanomyces astaci]|uniref:Uncharacterized protein n=1 Tax=Aphanomyces astaci TaxID=112090 RepID=A0A397BNE5_APHAT|nr:hypothetical protein DYB36_000350 [Aphanomyces astaci]RHY19691.1 hypothetical protein DYB25_002746 [Aphanomyces astaci]RHY37232.1 hypothetical protein DYB34_001837 [Aphanomyces astaci]RHY55796.1 hypothetical protein DYB30_002862 [Aphanomyces astaci]RHY64022.1 hypothetical protein DYB38_002516 [Aphanomyces astaci]
MAAVGPSKSRALYYEMQLREALLASDNVHALFDKERRVQRCIRLADELCGDLTVFGPILRTLATSQRCRGMYCCFNIALTTVDTILVELKAAIFRCSAEFQSLQEHALAKHTNVLVNERLLRKEVNITMGELADTQEMQAMSVAITQYQAQIRELQRERATSDSVRKDFESVRLMASASPPSTHDAATKELLQTLQTDMQLLLLRNARLREYDSDIQRCSPDMRHKYVKEQEAAIGDVAKQTSSLDNNHASDVVPITQVCFDFVEDRPQLDLFGSVFAGEVDQSAWWYLMSVKRHVAQLELDITTDQALRVVGQFLLLPQADVNAVEVCLDE